MGPVTVRSDASFRNEIEAGKHKFISDEPVGAGGTDEGPTPYDFLAAALGSCTAMTLHFFAKREKIPLEGVEVRLTHDRTYAKDCADCMSSTGYIHRFEVELRLRGNLTTEQREGLLAIAKRCPVYKTLTAEIKIVERLVD